MSPSTSLWSLHSWLALQVANWRTASGPTRNSKGCDWHSRQTRDAERRGPEPCVKRASLAFFPGKVERWTIPAHWRVRPSNQRSFLSFGVFDVFERIFTRAQRTRPASPPPRFVWQSKILISGPVCSPVCPKGLVKFIQIWRFYRAISWAITSTGLSCPEERHRR